VNAEAPPRPPSRPGRAACTSAQARAAHNALAAGEREALRADADAFARASIASVREGKAQPQVKRDHEEAWRAKLADAQRVVDGLALAYKQAEDATAALLARNGPAWIAALGLPAAEAAVTEVRAALAKAEAKRELLLLFERWIAYPWQPPRLPPEPTGRSRRGRGVASNTIVRYSSRHALRCPAVEP